MKRILLPLLLIISALTGCGSFGGVDKVVIGIDDEFAPICFHDERNELVGFDIDLAREAAERMGVEIEFKPISWDNKEEEIVSGNVDMIWNGLDITEERKEYMIFTRPYMDDRQILLVRQGDDQGIHAEEDLAGKIVGTQAGSTSDSYINQNANLKNSLKEYKTYMKFNEVVAALKSGEIDVLICDELVARYEMKQDPGHLELLNVRIGSIAEMAVGFGKDKIELRDEVQKAFNGMIKDGTAQKISEKWFQADLIRE
ncbi:MAG: amino acid ABC transporter substrate-binding protein [Selenomonadaceae bacterium]|nr:amino acid ABC transporter substrate-binding protein [Selenomonadaceae bacterium]